MIDQSPSPAFDETPESVHLDDLSIEQIIDLGSEALYSRILTELDKLGLADDPQIQRALYTALHLHRDDKRTDGPYIDHIMAVGLIGIIVLKIKDPNIIAALFFHDSVEDHPEEVLEAYPNSHRTGDLRIDALRALRDNDFLEIETLDIVDVLTCPEFVGSDRRRQYYIYVTEIIMKDPKCRIGKLANFYHNAILNHRSKEPLRTKMDLKQLPLYDIHIAAMYLPDSLVPEEVREMMKSEL